LQTELILLLAHQFVVKQLSGG